MGKEATLIGANTIQFFTRNPRGGKSKEPDEDDIRRYIEYAKEHSFGRIVAHAPYTLNPCSDKEKVREFAYIAMSEDIARLEKIPGTLYNFHPGSHVGQGTEKGIEMIADLLNRIITTEQKTIILLETMAGKGSEIGGTFEELKRIIERIDIPEKIGVCLDTCHVFDAGYDISDPDAVLDEFDRVIGMEKLEALHINDSKNPVGSHKDRHARLGEGMIGLESLIMVADHPAVKGLPCILETPNDLTGYEKEIELLR